MYPHEPVVMIRRIPAMATKLPMEKRTCVIFQLNIPWLVRIRQHYASRIINAVRPMAHHLIADCLGLARLTIPQELRSAYA